VPERQALFRPIRSRPRTKATRRTASAPRAYPTEATLGEPNGVVVLDNGEGAVAGYGGVRPSSSCCR